MKLSVPLLASILASTTSAYWLPEALECIKTCVVPKNETGTDDTPNVVKTVAECGDKSRVVSEKGITYNLWTPLQLKSLSNVEFVFNGNVSLPDNVSYVESVVADTSIYPGRWINFQGNNVTLAGSDDLKEGWFIGHGELWWPGGAANSVNKGRPHFFSLKVDYLRARHLKIWKPVAWVFSMGGSHVGMTDTLVNARSDDGFPFNAGGIDMSASHSLIEGFTIYNGDDLINVSPPTTNVTVRNMYSSGRPRRRLEDSLIGARFKGSLGTTCDLHNVTWRNFTVRNTSYPIHFIENYVDQEKGIPPGRNLSLAAYAMNFTWENFVGRTRQSQGWEGTDKGIYLLCADENHCKDFRFSNIDLKAYDNGVYQKNLQIESGPFVFLNALYHLHRGYSIAREVAHRPHLAGIAAEKPGENGASREQDELVNEVEEQGGSAVGHKAMGRGCLDFVKHKPQDTGENVINGQGEQDGIKEPDLPSREYDSHQYRNEG
ncbi:pectin lyase fold/virulence factor [Apiospora phragmitis]|uniref:Pectin lyase fold/virulence factor n=1 Tax=Apiospora phragmitis TaxID=2905665 RepID=A0ABR1WUB4_9PEZI